MKVGENINIALKILNEETAYYLDSFSCGNENIDGYFKEKAVADKTNVTYLYIDTDEDALFACVTLACSAIMTLNYDHKCSTIIPAMEIKYFAMDTTYQHMQYFAEKKKPSLSDMVLDSIIDKLYELSHTSIGASKIVLYSVPKAKTFYERHFFKEFGDDMFGDEGYYVSNCIPMYFTLNSNEQDF